MFNRSLKKEAIKIHGDTAERYNSAYNRMNTACENLYSLREDVVEAIKFYEELINTIAKSPKEFDVKLGEIKEQVVQFHETEEVVQEAYQAEMKAGKNAGLGAATGLSIATMAPKALMGIATTFGTASTGTAISTLSGIAAKKAAEAWIGRTFASFAVKGAGMAAGKAFLALAGPVGWGVTALSTGVSLISLSKKNKEISDAAVEEAKEMSKAREALDEITASVESLHKKIETLYGNMVGIKDASILFRNADYSVLNEEEKRFLGSLVNNTLSLSKLLNETVA